MIDKHYLAGFFDGEGCIFTCIKKSKHPKKTYLYPDLNVSIGQSGEEGKQILLDCGLFQGMGQDGNPGRAFGGSGQAAAVPRAAWGR